jgi:hypothetical protein
MHGSAFATAGTLRNTGTIAEATAMMTSTLVQADLPA